MLNTRLVKLTLPIILASTTAIAGGMEKTALSTAFMFESGNYAELSFQSSDYDVSSSAGGNASVVGDLQATNFAVKFDLNEQISFGVTRYLQSSIDVDYPGNWGVSGEAPLLPTADLKIDATTALVNYHLNENFSVLGGVKISTVRDASVKIPFAATDMAVSGDSETSYVYGVAYERPEIALRAELIREEDVDFALAANGTFGVAMIDGSPVLVDGVPVKLDATGAQASLPTYTTLNLQSGIAPDTLAFLTARRADWASHQVILSNAYASEPISNFTDTTTYSVGIGRKLTENLSGSVAYNWEEGTGPVSDSSLSITDGYRGISVGLKYTSGNMTISGGVNYTQLGDTVVTQALNESGDVFTDAPFTDNTVTSIGLKIGYHF